MPLSVNEVRLEAGRGVLGDHYRNPEGPRQVTLIQSENLAAVASYLRKDHVDPSWVRRNIVTSGINLLALKGRRLRVGEAILEVTGECHPCSRMEENLGVGGYNAMRGIGGITARVLQSGLVRVEDSVEAVPDEPQASAASDT